MIAPSRVMPRYHRDFRKLVRLRHFLVGKRTDIKNRIHSILDGELFQLSLIFSDMFGVSGQRIMEGIQRGSSVEQILQSIPPWVLAKKENELRALIEQNVSPNAMIQLGHCLRVVRQLDEEIEMLTDEALTYVLQKYPREYTILKSVPGIGNIAAITLIAEIGNFSDFISGNKLASWIGIVPKVYQSANHIVKCSITKRGSRIARWIMTEVAHAAIRQRKNVFREWYEEKKAVIGSGKAIIAVARKMTTIIWHLIVNDEEFINKYNEPEQPKSKKVHTIHIPVSKNYTVEQVLALVADAINFLNKSDPDPI